MGDPHLTVSGFSTKMLLLLLCLFGTLGGVVARKSISLTYVPVYPGTDLAGVKALLEAWNNTPNASTTFKNWGANTDPCGVAGTEKWAGVDCSSSEDVVTTDPAGNGTVIINAKVTELSFRGASLTGNLPPQISLLSGLTRLYLTNDPDLLGPIPKGIELLTELYHIDLSGNSLSGEFPNANFSMLSGLSSMNISRNGFQGSIKQDYFQGVSFLKELDLSMNNFTGVCPDLSYWKYVTNLNISCNNFTGPFPDFRSTPLETLNVSSNLFTGLSHNLSAVFLALPNLLSVLDLSSLVIKGPLPVWSKMPDSELSELYLDNNHITGIFNVSELVASTIGKKLNVLSL